MFCKNCGKEIDQNAYICIHCGVRVGIDTPPLLTPASGNAQVRPNGITLGIIGLIFAFLMPFLTWICSSIGMTQSVYTNNDKGQALNLIALMLSSIMFVIYLLLVY
jgi:hypothetical protein